MISSKNTLSLCILGLLAGCGGSSGSDEVSFDSNSNAFVINTTSTSGSNPALSALFPFLNDFSDDTAATSRKASDVLSATFIRGAFVQDGTNIYTIQDFADFDLTRVTSAALTLAPDTFSNFNIGAVAIERTNGNILRGYYIAGTPTENIPNAGSATYNGRTALRAVDLSSTAGASGTSYDMFGDVEVVAAFASKTASVTLDNFTATNSAGAATAVPFVILEYLALPLANASYEGRGNFTTAVNHGDAFVAGTGTALGNLEGSFFGDDPTTTRGPLETAGSFSLTGDQGAIVGVFGASR